MTGWILGSKPTFADWRIIWYICVSVFTVGEVVYLIWGSAERATFTFEKTTPMKNMQNNDEDNKESNSSDNIKDITATISIEPTKDGKTDNSASTP